MGPMLLRPYVEADQKQVVALWQAVFNHPLSLEEWQWKYHRSPYGHRAMLCLNENGEIIVFFGGIPFTANHNGQTRIFIQLMDIMSHPDYRGSRVFGKTATHFFDSFCRADGAQILYGFPGQYHYNIGVKHLGYVGLDQTVGCFQLNLDLLQRETQEEERAQSKSVDGLSDGQQRFKKGTLFKVRRPDFRFNFLWHCRKKEYPYTVQRDAAFIHWRFCRHPVHSYDIWGFKKGLLPFVDAWAVIKEDVHQKQAIIVDYFGPPSDGVNGSFLTHLIGHYRQRGIESIVTWLPQHHFIAQALLSVGFFKKDEPLGIISTVRPFDHSPPTDWMSTHLYYTMADADLY